MAEKIRRFAVCAAAGLMAVCVLCLSGCGKKKGRPAATEQPNSQITYIEGADFTGVVKSLKKKKKKITLYNTVMDVTEEYSYSGATEILSKNERPMVADELSAGDVLDIYTSDDGRGIEKMQETADIITEENAEVSVDSEAKRLTVRDVAYAYSDEMVVCSDGDLIAPADIAGGDKVTFRGVRGRAYSIVVTQGHGYIRPKNYGDFSGGRLIVHGEAILPVSDNMLLYVPEGTQTLTMANTEFTATVSVAVKRGKVTDVDISKYVENVPDVARVNFLIEPEGAELYVDGTEREYKKPVGLRYGNHSVRVVLDGYNEYSGVLSVNEANPTVSINLSLETAQVDSGSSEDGDSADGGNSSGNSSNGNDSAGTSSGGSSENGDGGSSVTETESTEERYDEKHKIYVNTPKGAAVYVNGTYKGEAPCSFVKLLGKITVTLSKDGYAAKSYEVEISDDEQDITWSFPALKKSGVG